MGGILAAAAVAAGTLVGAAAAGPPAVAAAAAGTGTGWLHTNGSKIVDSAGATVRLTGINWFGMETGTQTFDGLWAGKPATWTQQLDHMASLGYNTIRVPYTGSAITAGAVSGVNTDTNPDLIGLTPMQILDKVVDYAGNKGMRIILDRHRPTIAGQTPLWNGNSVSEASMIADWKTMANHYKNNTTVVGADLFNEPHAEGTDPNGTGANWGGGGARDWRLAAERIGNAILSVQPNWLIIVEGVSCDLPSGGSPDTWDNKPDDPMTCGWWGGNLSMAREFPVRLDVPNRLVYSAHEYGISVYDRQPWFKDANFPANLPAVWDHFWGYLHKENIAPVLVGEFGSTLRDPMDAQWLKALMAYMGKGPDGMSFTYWSWNPNSGDTGGIVSDDWNTVNEAKQSILSPYLIPPIARPTPSTSGSNTTPTPSGTCSATFTQVNSFEGGFQGEVTVKAGTSAIKSWTVTWPLDGGQSISQLWNGTLTTSGTQATVKSLAWNGALKAGASTAFGFSASGTAGTPVLACAAA
ncbi:MAG: endoglucanase [Actinomycetota bacterium]|nr:endoglucanase [Actinomycetota bacterium]